ncbi:MAG TPA: D-alanyl-D-alanine carboxypeptidase/D-alanyl-D-alanine-endopeptidase [Gemmatimonadaceae bacterium]|nr:D-alanyl-D-alanine carboxypeptidase/D-alanyl-D-alanine-endopeptidase [Gemmatimonadaceae bacterium]
MIRSVILATAILAACVPATPLTVTPTPERQRAALRWWVDSVVTATEFRNAHWGILVVDPERGDTLVAQNASKLFMPASNMKIVTGAVALAQLGADFRFRTTLLATGPIVDGTLFGDLLVVGRGDPSLSDHMRGDAMLGMLEIADSIAARGIVRIEGRIRAEGDAFPGAIYGYGWSWDEVDEAYSAGVDELYFNEGFSRIVIRGGAFPGEPVTASVFPSRGYPRVRVEARTVAPPDSAITAGDAVFTPLSLRVERDTAAGTVVVRGAMAPRDSQMVRFAHASPPTAYITALMEALEARAMSVAGNDSVSRSAAQGRRDTIAVILSPPLREIMPAFEKPSQNQIGEILLRTLGLERTGVGTPDSGRVVIERQLVEWGISRDGFVVRDGSGLSRYNYLSPETIVRVLDVMRRDTLFDVFYEALPVAGVDGTLANRMKGTYAEANAHAKTGFVSQARSLSGYVTSADGRLLLYSLLCNNWTVPVRTIERVQDTIVARLAGMTAGAR